jgi:hypothetical protein
MWLIIKKPATSMPSSSAVDVLRGDVGLGAVRRDADGPDTERVRPLEVLDGPHAGEAGGW